ncbi:MAG: hypothetical protein Fur005_44780 [Roseiflexaceae bacterium]
MTNQTFRLGAHAWQAEADPATPVLLAGPPMYVITSIGGGVHAYGDEHLQGQMGGVWAHPIRVLHGWQGQVSIGESTYPLDQAEACELFGSHLIRSFTTADLAITWTEFVTDELPALVARIQISNRSAHAVVGQFSLHATLDLRGCWFGGWGACDPAPNEHGALLTMRGSGKGLEGRAAAILAEASAAWLIDGTQAIARMPLRLEADEVADYTIVLAVAHAGGTEAATDLARRVRTHADELFEKKQQRQSSQLAKMTLTTPDPTLNAAWDLACQNLHLLAAAYPDLPPYFLAGLPEYPQLFGCDTEYTTAGATAAGYGPLMRSTLHALADYAERACARIPHEVTTNGRVFHPGNIQETPQFAAACWDYLRWSGDLAFVEQIYPLCVEGLDHFGHVIAGHGYPYGDGIVERPGMGAFKLDSVCYLYQALNAMRRLALAIGRDDDAPRFAEQAAQLRERFERDWWIDSEGMYADSLHLDRRQQFDGHWTVVLPIQLGMAQDARATRALARIRAEWVNEWGLVHTRGTEERVWTLPSGLLALAAFDYHDPDLGITLLRNIAETANHGSLGMLKELIPIGLCFVQLWSAGLLLQGITEGLLGLHPLAHLHRLDIRPNLPSDWPQVSLQGIMVGEHTIDLVVTPTNLQLFHRQGPCPLTIAYGAQLLEVAVGAEINAAI